MKIRSHEFWVELRSSDDVDAKLGDLTDVNLPFSNAPNRDALTHFLSGFHLFSTSLILFS
jgi:hypothetical protein